MSNVVLVYRRFTTNKWHFTIVKLVSYHDVVVGMFFFIMQINIILFRIAQFITSIMLFYCVLLQMGGGSGMLSVTEDDEDFRSIAFPQETTTQKVCRQVFGSKYCQRNSLSWDDINILLLFNSLIIFFAHLYHYFASLSLGKQLALPLLGFYSEF